LHLEYIRHGGKERGTKYFFLENGKGEGHFDDVNIRTELTENGCEGALDSGDSE